NMRINGLEADFVRARVGAEHITQIPSATASGDSASMPQHTVPSVMTHFGLEQVEVLHADVQGAELGLLATCSTLFATGKIRFVVISTHHFSISGSASTHADCVAFLKSMEANILCEHDVDESYSGDGLIVAAMRTEDRLVPAIQISRCRRSHSLFATG